VAGDEGRGAAANRRGKAAADSDSKYWTGGTIQYGRSIDIDAVGFFRKDWFPAAFAGDDMHGSVLIYDTRALIAKEGELLSMSRTNALGTISSAECKEYLRMDSCPSSR
jgi:hypothetical protein